MSLHRAPPERVDPMARKPRERARTARALLVAAVTFAGFSVGYFDAALTVAIDQLIVFCGVRLP
jgi:hypothetical protein